MVKQHIIRIAAPNTWPIAKKKRTFVTRPLPGGHSFDKGISINTAMKELSDSAKTSKEVKKILNQKEILIDGKRKKEPKHILGLMDILSMPEVKKNWRMLLTDKGKLNLLEIDEKESKIKLCQINNKTKIKKGKTQINTHDGRNILVDKDPYKTGDTIIINVPEQKITEHIKLEKGVMALLTGGKNSGAICKIEEITGNTIQLKKGEETFETLKKFAFVIGKTKPAIKVE